MLKDKKIFISGGAGVIGRELIPKLLDQRAKLWVGDLKPQPTLFENKLIYRQGDLRTLQPWEVAAFQPEIFIHLAATFERSEETYEFWYENFAHNIFLSNHLMSLLKDTPHLKKVVFASSYLIYDKSLYLFDKPQAAARKLLETDPINPRNLTGMAKLAHELELNFINKFHGQTIQIVCPRIFRGFGRGSRDVISRWIKALLNNEEIILYGKEARFDYIEAAETAEGLLRIIHDNNIRGIVNLGTGKAHQVLDIVSLLQEHFPNAKIIEKSSDLPYEASQADTTLLHKHLNWTPNKPLSESIATIIEYEQEQIKKNQQAAKYGHVLITSVAKKVPMVKAVKSAMARIDKSIRVLGADVNANALAQHFCDGFWHMPALKDLEINKIIEFAEEENIFLIIPSRDGELEYWSQHKEQLAKRGIQVMVSALEP